MLPPGPITSSAANALPPTCRTFASLMTCGDASQNGTGLVALAASNAPQAARPERLPQPPPAGNSPMHVTAGKAESVKLAKVTCMPAIGALAVFWMFTPRIPSPDPAGTFRKVVTVTGLDSVPVEVTVIVEMTVENWVTVLIELCTLVAV